jgi:hypothetical protein
LSPQLTPADQLVSAYDTLRHLLTVQLTTIAAHSHG